MHIVDPMSRFVMEPDKTVAGSFMGPDDGRARVRRAIMAGLLRGYRSGGVTLMLKLIGLRDWQTRGIGAREEDFNTMGDESLYLTRDMQ
ncbi:hypothetical protein E4U21_002631 [Claviceps maximensis]|nr:hypothetical protein E4U21_002631 [Claviceps maximensis]